MQVGSFEFVFGLKHNLTARAGILLHGNRASALVTTKNVTDRHVGSRKRDRHIWWKVRGRTGGREGGGDEC